MIMKPVATRADPTIGKWLRLRTFAALALAILGITPVNGNLSAAAQPALDRDAFLSAVAEVETGGNARAVGRRGERGLYQFTRATWQRHSSRPFTEAHNPTVAYGVATQHFNWLRDRLGARGGEPTAYRMAVAWNAGLNRALSGAAPRSTRDYARRVSNLASIQRPPARPVSSAPATLVAVHSPALVHSPAPVAASISLTAPDVVPISFSLGRSDAFSIGPIAADVVAEPAEEVSFRLARPADTTATPPRRLIFATIGE